MSKEEQELARRQEQQGKFAAVQHLSRQLLSTKEIAYELGLHEFEVAELQGQRNCRK